MECCLKDNCETRGYSHARQGLVLVFVCRARLDTLCVVCFRCLSDTKLWADGAPLNHELNENGIGSFGDTEMEIPFL